MGGLYAIIDRRGNFVALTDSPNSSQFGIEEEWLLPEDKPPISNFSENLVEVPLRSKDVFDIAQALIKERKIRIRPFQFYWGMDSYCIHVD